MQILENFMQIDNRERFEQIITSVGEPYFRNENIAIYHGNSDELLSLIPEGNIDLTLTSPPYNIGKEYETVQDVESYVSWCKSWLGKIFHATSKNGALALNVGYLEVPGQGFAVPIPYLLWDKTDFYMHQEIVWNYGAGVAAKKRLSPRNEKVMWMIKDKLNYTFNLDPIRDPDVKYPNQKKNGKLRCNPLGKNPSDVWQIPKVTSGKDRSSKERAPHPAQFPLELVRRMMEGFSNPNDIILDPFLGSGTTVDCAIRKGRFAIGIELNADYIKYAKKRLLNSLEDIHMEKAQNTLSL